MKPTARNREILRLLAREKELSVDEACRRFSISPATARRAFAQLVESGAAEKTWGGVAARVAPAELTGAPLPTLRRLQENVEAKEAIAEAAARKVAEGDIVFIDGGSTTFRLAAHLANRAVRIVTNSLLIAQEIDRLRRGQEGAEVFLAGGFLYPFSSLTVGPEAIAAIRRYHATIAFLSAGGIDQAGASNNHHLVVEIERAMLENADAVYLLADSTKFERREMVRECEWHEIQAVITNEDAGWRRAGVDPERVELASPSTPYESL